MTKQWITKHLSHTVLFCFAAIVLCFAIYNVTHVLLTYFSVEMRLAETIGRLIASVVIIVFYQQTFGIKTFGMKNEHFLQGVLTGVFMLVLIIANIPTSIGEVAEYPTATPSLYLLIIVVIEQIFVGIFEEFLFRGLILNTLLETLKRDGHKGMVLSIIISSFLFGIVHLVNLFDTPELVNATIAQSAGAMFIGIFLGALYCRCGNIWVVVFYHALIDIIAELPGIFHHIPETTGAVTDWTLAGMGINILANTVLLFAGLFLARTSKCPSKKQPD